LAGRLEPSVVFLFIDVFLWTGGTERKRPAGTALVRRMQQWMPLTRKSRTNSVVQLSSLSKGQRASTFDMIKKVGGLVPMIVGAVLISNFYLTMG